MTSKWKSAVNIRGKQMSMKEQREQNRRNSVGEWEGDACEDSSKERRKKEENQEKTD